MNIIKQQRKLGQNVRKEKSEGNFVRMKELELMRDGNRFRSLYIFIVQYFVKLFNLFIRVFCYSDDVQVVRNLIRTLCRCLFFVSSLPAISENLRLFWVLLKIVKRDLSLCLDR